jgi:atypical dual specificity phosphatase
MSTWWIDEPFLLGGGNPSEAELQDLYEKSFRIIISLLDEIKQPPKYNTERATTLGYTRSSIAIPDFQPPSLDQIDEFITLLSPMSGNTRVLVHCEGGSGRTGTMGAAYWIAKGLSAADAIRKVRQANPHAVETPEQERILDEFEEVRKRAWKHSTPSESS